MKKTISLLLALVMCLSLCACGTDNGNKKNNDSKSGKPVKITSKEDLSFTAYKISDDEKNNPSDVLVIEEVTLLPKAWSNEPLLLWKIKVRNHTGKDFSGVPNEFINTATADTMECINIHYRYLDENKDVIHTGDINSYSDEVKEGQATWIQENSTPGGWTSDDTLSIAYIEFYEYSFQLFNKSVYKFEEPLIVDVRGFFEW